MRLIWEFRAKVKSSPNFREAEPAARGQTIARNIFVSDAPDGTSGCSEHFCVRPVFL